MTSPAALTCPLPGPGAQRAALPRKMATTMATAAAAAPLLAPEEGVKTGAAVCVRTAGPRPLPGLRAPPNSRESGICESEPAAVLTFHHGAEGGHGRGRRCEGSAQAGPPLPSLGGEKQERATGTAAAIAEGCLHLVGVRPAAAALGASWGPIGCGSREGRGERCGPGLIGHLRCH